MLFDVPLRKPKTNTVSAFHLQRDVYDITLDFVHRIGGPKTDVIPQHVAVVLQLLGGVPRLLEHALSCMSGNRERDVNGRYGPLCLDALLGTRVTFV